MRTIVVGLRFLICAVAAVLAGVACSERESGVADTGTAGDEPAAAAGPEGERCYQSPVSVLLGPDRGGTSEGKAPGMLRFDDYAADSGLAVLTDAGGGTLQGRWTRTGGDSVVITAFDDFLRVEMRLAVDDDSLAGNAAATSDAALERDSTGRMQELRRTWRVTARRLRCGARAPGS